MKSGELAQLAGVTVRALRHYHAIGLLPEPPRGENGYRDYGADEFVRVLRIKRLSSLGFSLSRIAETLDEMDANLADAIGPKADEALDALDRELELQIERLQEQRRTIAQLKSEQLDPDLPVRFARAAKVIIGDSYLTSPTCENDREALLIAGHFYTENDVDELERTVEALRERGLLDQMQAVQGSFDDLKPDASREEIEQVVSEVLDLLDPVIDCFDPANWDSDFDAQGVTFFDELLRRNLNKAQIIATDLYEAEVMKRVSARKADS